MAKNTYYLYGAAVQGIQSFIFQTNELKDIVGASELVEEICTSKFAELLYGKQSEEKVSVAVLQADKNAILHAAGNMKYVFSESEKHILDNLVLNFPREVMNYAPGITISQAVVKYVEDSQSSEQDSQNCFKEAVSNLEKRLRAQRNKPMPSTTLGLMGVLRSRKTGLPVVHLDTKKEEYLDEGTCAKRFGLKKVIKDSAGLCYEWKPRETTPLLCQKAFGQQFIRAEKIALDITNLTDKNDWVAIIHADGNGLGQIVQKIGSNRDQFKEFSKRLDQATTEAAVSAYNSLFHDFNLSDCSHIPIRPIVLGGDDLTVICRADIALDYTTKFIDSFEQKTKELLGDIIAAGNVFTEGDVKDRLTACAGIAYIKSSYPFYYGYELAEALCSRAKKDAKNKASIKAGKELPPSCLLFHKVQDSFTESYDEMAKRELQPQPNISFEYGPYYLNQGVATERGRWTVEELKSKASKLQGKEGSAVKSHLRNWMSLLHENLGMAEQKLERLKTITTELELVKSVTASRAITEKEGADTSGKIYPTYDVLALHTINNQETNKKENEL